MKARYLVDHPEVRPDATTSVRLPSGEYMEIGVLGTAPAGSIIEGPRAFWLCGVFHSFIRDIREGQVEVVTLDGLNGQRLQYICEPADEACLKLCVINNYKHQPAVQDPKKLKVDVWPPTGGRGKPGIENVPDPVVSEGATQPE